jgi:hypothetical protein
MSRYLDPNRTTFVVAQEFLSRHERESWEPLRDSAMPLGRINPDTQMIEIVGVKTDVPDPRIYERKMVERDIARQRRLIPSGRTGRFWYDGRRLRNIALEQSKLARLIERLAVLKEVPSG